MNKTKKYSVIPINNSTRKSRTSNSDTFMALQYPAYKRDIKERKEREQIEIKKRSLRNLAIQLSKGDNKAKEEESKLSENELEQLKILKNQIKRAEQREKEKELYLLQKPKASRTKPIPIEAPTPVITNFEPPFDVDVSKGMKRSPSRRRFGGKRKQKKGKRKSTKKK